MTAFCLIYITAKDPVEARSIGTALLQEKLVACVNVFRNMNSLYWWEGAIVDETESLLIAKSRQDLLPKIIERTKALSSYDVPCVVALPIIEGNPDYLSWLGVQTS